MVLNQYFNTKYERCAVRDRKPALTSKCVVTVREARVEEAQQHNNSVFDDCTEI